MRYLTRCYTNHWRQPACYSISATINCTTTCGTAMYTMHAGNKWFHGQRANWLSFQRSTCQVSYRQTTKFLFRQNALLLPNQQYQNTGELRRRTTTTTTTTTTTILRPFVRDYPCEPVPEETLTHPPSWSSNLYQLLPSTTIHSIRRLNVKKTQDHFYSHYRPASVSWHPSWNGWLEFSVPCQHKYTQVENVSILLQQHFYCPHALSEGN